MWPPPNCPQARALLQEQLGGVQAQLREMQIRFERREPRSEDLAQMDALRKQLKDKDEIVRRTYEEMKYFKLELKNREENFNQVGSTSTLSPPLRPVPHDHAPIHTHPWCVGGRCLATSPAWARSTRWEVLSRRCDQRCSKSVK